jgi:hypothetical protein
MDTQSQPQIHLQNIHILHGGDFEDFRCISGGIRAYRNYQVPMIFVPIISLRTICYTRVPRIR